MSSRRNAVPSIFSVSPSTRHLLRRDFTAGRPSRFLVISGWVLLGMVAMLWTGFLLIAMLFGLPMS